MKSVSNIKCLVSILHLFFQLLASSSCQVSVLSSGLGGFDRDDALVVVVFAEVFRPGDLDVLQIGTKQAFS